MVNRYIAVQFVAMANPADRTRLKVERTFSKSIKQIRETGKTGLEEGKGIEFGGGKSVIPFHFVLGLSGPKDASKSLAVIRLWYSACQSEQVIKKTEKGIEKTVVG